MRDPVTGWALIRRVRGAGVTALWLLLASACVSPPPPKPPEPIAVPTNQKMAWILQLEDKRILRLEQPAPPPPPVPAPGRRPAPVVVPPMPDSSPDLAVLIKDKDPRIRRRAALALGRVKDAEGLAPLVGALADTDPDVRAMAAFALGLIGAPTAEESLTPLLGDASPLVRGRAAEALGQIGAKGAAAAIGKMAAEYAKSAPVVAMEPDDQTWPAAPEADAFKLGLFALVRLGSYDPLAGAVLEGGSPVGSWWPIAYALQRIGDPRAAPALTQLLGAKGRYTRAFAARGLGDVKEASATDALIALVEPSAKAGLEVTVSAIRALGKIAAPQAAGPLSRLATDTAVHPNVRLEAVNALGAAAATDGLAAVQDLLTDDWPAMRAAAIRAAVAIDRESFVSVLSGMEPDRDWRVRAALAEALGTLPPELSTERLRSMLKDEDKRVIPAVLTSLVRLKAPDLAPMLLQRLEDTDLVVRATAAQLVGELKPDGGAEPLRELYKSGAGDAAYSARTAALDALATYGTTEAVATLRTALEDKDWAVRVRAAELLGKLDPSVEAQRLIRPVPATPTVAYDDPGLIAPNNSPHAFIETAYGTIEFELAVLDAPQTSRSFMALARKGFFNGLEVHRVVANFVVQDGDPRGDGEGGPGFTIRDELNERPFLRGTVGMALEWRDTGGSQFFITHSPQPHLDARYTVFGHVVNGMDVVDRIKPGDVIIRVRVWDGTGWQGTDEPSR
jgi:HEAT repeat protein/cyclophilin family peptidyl-prolyl cis-trans isomerase